MAKEFEIENWEHMKRLIRLWWTEIPNEEIDRINGKWARLVTKVQNTYGYTNRDRAELECRTRLQCS
jgi:hypothetical protein